MILDEILGLPRSGVILVIKGQSARISYTTSIATELQSLYRMFKGELGVELKFVSVVSDLETLKIHTEYYRNLYHTQLGYGKLVQYGRKSIEYRIRTVPSEGFTGIDVELVTARGDKAKIVGRFKSNFEAKEFIETYYGLESNPFKLPVYALNSDTKEFLLRQEKLLYIK